MRDQADFDAGDFADRLAAMSDDELFETRGLKTKAKTSIPTSATAAMCLRKSPWSRRPSRIGFQASSLRRTRIGSSVEPLAEQERLS